MEIKGDWVFTYAKYLQEDYDKMNVLGIYNERAYDTEPFRFKLSLVESYNKAHEGLTTIYMHGERTTIMEDFDKFDQYIISSIKGRCKQVVNHNKE